MSGASYQAANRHSGGIVIRPETPGDLEAIRRVTERAFRGKPYASGNEPDIPDALRDAGALSLSLVAEDDGEIVGHVGFSPAFAADGSTGWYTLAPVSVAPAHQRQGIGGALIREGLSRLGALGARGCIVLGDTRYYPRHGFVPRPDLAPAGAPAEHFMVLRLDGRPATTRVDFHRIFDALDEMP